MSRSWRLAILVSPLLAACTLMGANADAALAAAEALPPYQPQEQVSGTIRLWGHGSTSNDFMQRLVTRWERRFVGIQPGVSIEYRMYGTASAIGALYEGAGDLAILMDAGVGVVMGRTDSIASDVGMILWAQSTDRAEVRRLFSDKLAFRNAALDFMDGFEAGVYQEATPRVLQLIEAMNHARTAVQGESGKAKGPQSPKAGGRAG